MSAKIIRFPGAPKEAEEESAPEVVTMNLLLPPRVLAWLARHSASDAEAEEMAASILTMVVDDDEAAHAVMQ